MDDGNWLGGLDDLGVGLGDEDLGTPTLDGGDGDGDGDGDGGDSDEDEFECIGKELEKALDQLLSKLDPDERDVLTHVISLYAAPPGGFTTHEMLKPFYVLLVTRNKQTGEPLYNASAMYRALPADEQQQIQAAIATWDAIPDNPDRWKDLSTGLGEQSISTSALKADLILSFQFTRLVTDALHEANDTFLKKWGSANFLALVTLLTTKFTADDIADMATFMATYQVSNLGYPPFALGAQAVLLAYTILLELTTLENLEKCLDDD
ncbi:MAG TPA: hypothetical protein VHQ65_04735 [Thermoanaerobaculia bacterium]|nr:hypothetical protein [Thermoanaerobaculia bacterium]